MSLANTARLIDSFDGGCLVPADSLNWDSLQRQPDVVLSMFEAAFDRTNCKFDERFAPAENAPAAYLPFIYYPRGGGRTFANEMLVNLANRTPEQIAISKRHEKVHAIQWNNIPALHASPYNQITSFVLSPESWVLMTILTERDAFTKTAWLTALELCSNTSQALKAQAETETVRPSDIDMDTGNIRSALQASSLVWDKRLKGKSKANDLDVELLDHYINQALDAYEKSNRLNPQICPQAPVFVRLDHEDILAIGASFGPSIFGQGTPDDRFLKLPQLSKALQDRLEALNKKHGITDEKNVATFFQALKAAGWTPEEYMEQSMSYTYRPRSLGRIEHQQYYEIQTPEQA